MYNISEKNVLDCITECCENGDRNQIAVARMLDVSLRTLQRLIKQYNIDYVGMRQSMPDKGIDPEDFPIDETPISAGTTASPDRQRGVLTGKRFVFTSAQNNTLIHEGFFEGLQLYCAENDAQLVVSRFAYNKAGWKQTKDSDDLWYDDRILPFVIDHSCVIEGIDVVWCGELDINPTAANPLSSLHSYTQEKSGVIPHAKVQLQSCPVFKGDDPKTMYTTGAITQRNYIPRKTGQIAAFHHVIGALVVEIDDDGDWFARQLIANEEGVFHDLDTKYTEYGSSKHSIECINYGDIHAEKADLAVARASWCDRPDSMLNVLQPRRQFVHDVSDFMARNHHNRDNAFFLAEMHANGTDSVEDGLGEAANTLHIMHRDWCETIVVHSNHDAALKLWMQTADTTKDPANVRFWHEANAEMYKNIEQGNPSFDPFAWFLKERCNVTARFLAPDESVRVLGIEFGMHGHMGISGARGSNASFKKLNTKVNVGHTHSPTIVDGVYCAGVGGSMEMGYNKGITTWAQAHIVTYGNGKRAIVQVKNGKWRA